MNSYLVEIYFVTVDCAAVMIAGFTALTIVGSTTLATFDPSTIRTVEPTTLATIDFGCHYHGQSVCSRHCSGNHGS
jgi:hypothetical protein